MKALRLALFCAPVFAAPALAQPSGALLYVSGRDALVAYDATTGEERQRFATPGISSDMLVTPGGHVILNHRDGHAVLIIEAATGREVARLPSSGMGGRMPVHSYLLAMPDGRWIAAILNDGVEAQTPPGTAAQDSTMMLIGASEDRPDFGQVLGEIRLGRGHHKLAVTRDGARVSISNTGDCGELVGIYTLSPPARIASFGAASIGLDGSTPERRCDPTRAAGVRPSPHGTGMAAGTGTHFHNMNGTGQFLAIQAEATPPGSTVLATGGTGGASIAAHPAGRFLYAPQNTPRGGGNPCQAGQIAVLDGAGPALAAEIPILVEGPGCTAASGGVRPAYAFATPDGRSLFVTLGTLNPALADRARHVAVFDLSDPARPVQRPSIAVGAAAGHRDGKLTADGAWLVVPNGADNTVSILDTQRREVARSFPTVAQPNRVALVVPPARAATLAPR